MRIAVLGALGQLGRDLCPVLDGTVHPLSRPEADLTQPEPLTAALTSLHPDVVINCAAYNFVDRAEGEPEAAFAVNAWGVRNLARSCAALGCTLLHVSSDYVFGLDETRDSPYREEDAPGPVSVYGLSKVAGEYLVCSLVPRHFIVRTCGLYGLWGSGGKGGNFVETMLRLAAAGKPIRVVADQRCTPTATADLAQVIAALVQTDRVGVYHVTNAGSCSWFEFAAKLFELAGVKADLHPVTSREYAAAARRPGYSVLANDGIARLGLQPLRPWAEAVADYLRQRMHHG